MTNKPGTKWVSKGKGAGLWILEEKIIDYTKNHANGDQALMALKNIKSLSEKNRIKRTNLALTGEPLTAEDLGRIAECE